jgi:hypothetical protein
MDTTTTTSSNRSSLSASFLFLRNNRGANREAHLGNSSSSRYPAHQAAAYREYEAREQLSYVFGPELVVFNLRDAAARDFSCDLVPRGAECHPHGGSGQLAGTYVLARRMQETIEAGDLVPVQLRSQQQLIGGRRGLRFHSSTAHLRK